MQQMSFDDKQESWQRGYKGTRSSDYEDGQKIKIDDDEQQYAELLARKIKQELQDELPGKDPTIGHRLALAIVSICALIPIFIALIIALSLGLGAGGSGYALAYGIIAICFAIMIINVQFNHSSRKKQ